VNEQQQPANRWADVEVRYQPGQEVRGTVTRVAQFGVFVQVEPGIEGIVYAFELGQGPSALAGFAPGQEMQLYVKSIDAGRRRMELSLGNQPVPGLLPEHELPPAARRKNLTGEPLWPAPLLPPEAPARPGESSCPTCQREVQATWKYCVYCGGSLQRQCLACGAAQPDLPGARYCHACGRPVSH